VWGSVALALINKFWFGEPGTGRRKHRKSLLGNPQKRVLKNFRYLLAGEKSRPYVAASGPPGGKTTDFQSLSGDRSAFTLMQSFQ
jgi:hypothetical protein